MGRSTRNRAERVGRYIADAQDSILEAESAVAESLYEFHDTLDALDGLPPEQAERYYAKLAALRDDFQRFVQTAHDAEIEGRDLASDVYEISDEVRELASK